MINMEKVFSKIAFLFLLLFPLTVLEGCSKDDNTPSGMIIMSEDQTVQNVDAKGAEFTLSFKVRTNWTLETSDDCKDWIENVSYSAIGGIYEISIAVEANEQSSERTGTLIMKSGSDVKEIKVKQAAATSK